MKRNSDIRRSYISRALELIRVANGIHARNRRDLSRMAGEIRAAIAQRDLPSLGRREGAAVVAEVQAIVIARYGEIAARVADDLSRVTSIEAEFARRAVGFARAPSNASLARAAAAMLILGSPPEEAWRQQGQTVAFRVAGPIRDRMADLIDDRALQADLFGDGRGGGIVGQAERQARALADTGVTAAAEAGRREVYVANGANILRWQSVLDSKTTEGCAIRHGLLYTLDYQPIEHGVEIERPPPRHYNCRSMLVPENRPADAVPEDGETAAAEFDRWLDSLSESEVAETFGVGRLALYREGRLSKSDLVSQAGRVLTLAELRERIGD